MKERDVSKFLSRLPKDATYYFCQPDVPRALPAIELKREAEKWGMKGEVWDHPKDALNRLIVDANKEDIGLILGSIFLDRKSTRLNSSHVAISYAVFCLKKKKIKNI